MNNGNRVRMPEAKLKTIQAMFDGKHITRREVRKALVVLGYFEPQVLLLGRTIAQVTYVQS